MSTHNSNSPIRDLQHVTVYRNPEEEWNAVFPEITRLASGDLLVSFREARYPSSTGKGSHNSGSHDHSDPCCRGSIIRSSDGGQTWPLAAYQQLTEVLPMEQCVVSAASDDLVLFTYALNTLKVDAFECELRREDNGGDPWSAAVSCQNLTRRSNDGGHTWDDPTPMTPAPLLLAQVHAPAIELPDGTLLAPHCGSLTGDLSTPIQQHPQCVIRSHDRGRTWGDGSIVALDPSGRRRYHQASLVRMPDGEIIAGMHSEQWIELDDGRRAREVNAWLSRSQDAGRTWGPVESLPFRITGSATSLIRMIDGRLLFTWSDRHMPSIRVAVSADAGRSWSDAAGWSVRDGEHVPGSETLLQAWAHDGSVFEETYSDNGEPCTCQLADGRIITVYYWAQANHPMRYIEAAIYDVN